MALLNKIMAYFGFLEDFHKEKKFYQIFGLSILPIFFGHISKKLLPRY